MRPSRFFTNINRYFRARRRIYNITKSIRLMRKSIITIICLTLNVGGALAQTPTGTPLVEFVDTKIGVIDNRGSNCVIGPRLPYGSINPSPQTINGGMDGYNPNEPIRGFAQLQASGTGWGAYGHFLISPTTGRLDVGVDNHDSPHSDDVTKAYYYKTTLNRYNIKVEIAPAHYSAIYRFTFPKSANSHLILDATQAIASDIVPSMNGNVLQSYASVDSIKQQIRMKVRYEGGWVDGPYDLYIVGQYDKPAVKSGAWGRGAFERGLSSTKEDPKNPHSGVYLSFQAQANEQVLLKVAISFQGYDRAEMLLNSEIPNWDFDRVCRAGAEKWNDKLGRIEIETPSNNQKTMFYSALYRFFTLAADRSLDAPEWAEGKPYWDDVYALWDTFRTAYPLMTLIDEPATRDNILSMINRFKHNGIVCDGFIAGRDKRMEQGGNDVDNVIAEACLKNVRGIDWNEAYRILKYNADHRRIGYHTEATKGDGYDKYKENGWLPEGVMSTSQTLEFAYNDFCVAAMAQKLGLEEDYNKYSKRSHKWPNLWNATEESEGFKGFIDARDEAGRFAFYPTAKYGGSWKGPFYEGSSWTYSYFAPHDIAKLIKLMGGKERFAERLNLAHDKDLIDYANEPSFLTTRLFIDAGRPELTSYWVHKLMREKYDLTGYPQNDDTGAMSSWYVLSAIGLFPNAGQDYYYLNAPLYTKSTIHLSNDKVLTIKSDHIEGNNTFNGSFKLNGKKLRKPTIRHQEIRNGGIIEYKTNNN